MAVQTEDRRQSRDGLAGGCKWQGRMERMGEDPRESFSFSN